MKLRAVAYSVKLGTDKFGCNIFNTVIRCLEYDIKGTGRRTDDAKLDLEKKIRLAAPHLHKIPPAPDRYWDMYDERPYARHDDIEVREFDMRRGKLKRRWSWWRKMRMAVQ